MRALAAGAVVVLLASSAGARRGSWRMGLMPPPERDATLAEYHALEADLKEKWRLMVVARRTKELAIPLWLFSLAIGLEGASIVAHAGCGCL
jgi:hypothetical protein